MLPAGLPCHARVQPVGAGALAWVQGSGWGRDESRSLRPEVAQKLGLPGVELIRLPPPYVPLPPARSFKQESKHRSAVLRKLGFIEADGSVTLKGRAACEIDTAGGWLGVVRVWSVGWGVVGAWLERGWSM